MIDTTLYSLLSHLWLREPDAATLARAREVWAHPSTSLSLRSESAQDASPLNMDDDPATLAAAYADLFLLNVPPYGTAFTDEWGEMNTPDALRVAAQYAAYDYQPPELREVGAPDHLGLCLGFVAHLESPSPLRPSPSLGEGMGVRANFLSHLLVWAPVCCLAAERDPTTHPFYRALAQLTRETLLSGEWRVASGDFKSQIANRKSQIVVSHSPDDELRLRDIVRFLLAPARCGMFLSRARFGQMALALGMRLPFGSRFEVCEWLFASAGESEHVSRLLQLIQAEADAWAAAYRAWAAQHPAWQPIAAQWLARIDATQQMLHDMVELASHPLSVEYAKPSMADDVAAEG